MTQELALAGWRCGEDCGFSALPAGFSFDSSFVALDGGPRARSGSGGRWMQCAI